MNKRAYRALSVLLSLSLATAAFADEVDWPYYGADQGGTRYTPADQINRDNFDQLRVVWRYRPRDQQIYETARADRSRDRDRDRGRGRGDLLVQLVVDVPDDLTGEQEELVRRLAELRGEEVAEPSEGLLGRIRTAFR